MIAGFAILLAGGGFVWYIFNEKFTDTDKVKPAYTVNAVEFISEFKNDLAQTNKKYAEKVIVVNGIISAVEAADTTVNIKMIDTTGNAYIIFAFQQQHLSEAKAMKVGDKVAIKGSCSGGAYSEILETTFISFKRCAVNK